MNNENIITSKYKTCSESKEASFSRNYDENLAPTIEGNKPYSYTEVWDEDDNLVSISISYKTDKSVEETKNFYMDYYDGSKNLESYINGITEGYEFTIFIKDDPFNQATDVRLSLDSIK